MVLFLQYQMANKGKHNLRLGLFIDRHYILCSYYTMPLIAFGCGFNFHPSSGVERRLDFQVVEQNEDLLKFRMAWDTVLNT